MSRPGSKRWTGSRSSAPSRPCTVFAFSVLFLLFQASSVVVAFNVWGTVDIIGDYYRGYQLHLADRAGQLGAGYAIVMIYVPLLMITHVVAFYLLVRPQSKVVGAFARDVVAA